jgi:hypothetical protein
MHPAPLHDLKAFIASVRRSSVVGASARQVGAPLRGRQTRNPRRASGQAAHSPESKSRVDPEVNMASPNPTLLVLALGLTLTACTTGGASTSAPSSTSLPSPTPSVTAAPSVSATASPTAVPAPTYPANAMDVPDFSPLEVQTYFVEPVGTDIKVFYTIPAEGWMSWFGAFKPGLATDPPDSVVGLSIVNAGRFRAGRQDARWTCSRPSSRPAGQSRTLRYSLGSGRAP